MNDLSDLSLCLKSHLPILCVETREEPRLRVMLERFANLENWPLFIWSLSQGLQRASYVEQEIRGEEFDATETQELSAALKQPRLQRSSGLFVFLDPQPFFEDKLVLRLLKEAAQGAAGSRRKYLLVGSEVRLPPDLQRLSAHFSMPAANLERVRRIFKEELDQARVSMPMSRFSGQAEAVALFTQHLTGLYEDDVRRLAREALFDDCSINLDDISRVLKYKQESIGVGGVLSLELDCGSFAHVGGLNNLKRWLDRRKNVFLQDHSDKGLDAPRGVLLLGVQGSGKSLAAKAIAGSWRVPLLRLDFAALYSKWSGETERNLRDSLKAAEALAPCVLWIDEIEKGIATDAGETDGGVSRRILGTLLTWMTEHKSRVFLTATANDISRLPPELMRKGRFDEIFFVDLPDAETRTEIFAIHLRRRKQNTDGANLTLLGQQAEGFSGAEIEQVVVSALYEALALNQALSTELLALEIQRTRPLSVVMAEKLAQLRAWAAERTVPAQ